MELGLRDKVVFIGGASRGIGLAVARAFLEEGAHVAISARGAEGLRTAEATLAGEFPDLSVLALNADMRDEGEVDAAISQVISDLGGLDCVVASAGTGRGPGGWQPEVRAWRELLEENLMSAVVLCQRALPELRDGGAVALIGSVAGLADLGAPLPYSASKAALVRYTRDLARRVAPEGVRVNVVAPGNILFPGGRWEELLREDRDGVESYIGRDVPMARFGSPEEIASAVVFLCSERASFITGACLVADGGQLR